jgi:hypothetical protein
MDNRRLARLAYRAIRGVLSDTTSHRGGSLSPSLLGGEGLLWRYMESKLKELRERSPFGIRKSRIRTDSSFIEYKNLLNHFCKRAKVAKEFAKEEQEITNRIVREAKLLKED